MVEKDDVFELGGKLYCTLDVINYGGREFCLCNIIENESTFGANYAVFQNFPDGVERVEDDELLNLLSPIFSNNINMAKDTDTEE